MFPDLKEFFRSPVENHLKREFRRGLIISPDECLGFHGTSLETLVYIIEHGALPGITELNSYRSNPILDAKKGDVSFYPARDPSSLDEAGSYARTIAVRHYIFSKLGLDISSLDDAEFVDEFKEEEHGRLYDDYLPRLLRAGFNKRFLNEVLEQSYKQRGLIIGLKKEAGDSFHLYDAIPFGEEGWTIVTEGLGIPFNYIYGIKPLGKREENFLKKL